MAKTSGPKDPTLLEMLQFRTQLMQVLMQANVTLTPTMASHIEKIDKLISSELDRLLASRVPNKQVTNKRPRGRPPKVQASVPVLFNPAQ